MENEVKTEENEVKKVENEVKTVENEVKTADIWFHEGMDYWFNKQDAKEALKCFTEAIDKEPNHYKAYAERGNLQKHLGNNQEALVDVDKSIEILNNATASYVKAAILVILGKEEEAEECWFKAEDLETKDFSSYFHRGSALEDLGDKEEAIISYDQAISMNPNYAFTYYNKGNSLSDLGRNEEALACYDQAIKLNPNHGSIYYNKGNALDELGKKEEAILCYDQAIKLDPNNPSFYISKGAALSEIGQKLEAMCCYDQAIKIDPCNSYAYIYKGFILSEIGKKSEAITYYDKAILIDPEEGSAYINKGRALADLGRREEAISCYDKGIKLNPHSDLVYYFYNNKGNALADLGRKEEALKCYDEALKLDPNNSFIYKNKGNVLFDMGRKKEALSYYDQAIQLDPNDSVCYCGKGKVLIGLGQDEKALECFNLAHEKSQNDLSNNAETVNQDRASLLKKLTELQEAMIETQKLSEKLNIDDTAAVKIIQKLTKLKEKKSQLTNKFITSLEKNYKTSSSVIDRFDYQALFHQSTLLTQLKDEIVALKQEIHKYENDLLDSIVTAKADTASRRELQKYLAQLTFKSPQEKAKLTEYYNGFVRTFMEIFSTSQAIMSKHEITYSEDTPTVGVLAMVVAFIPLVGSRQLQGKVLDSLDALMRTPEMVISARKMSTLAKSAVELDYLVGSCAVSILQEPGKQKEILRSIGEEERKFIAFFEDELRDILGDKLTRKLSTLIRSKLFAEVFQSPGAKVANSDANEIIQKWVCGRMGPVGSLESKEEVEKIKQQFISVTTQKDKLDFTTNPEPESCINPMGGCQMF